MPTLSFCLFSRSQGKSQARAFIWFVFSFPPSLFVPFVVVGCFLQFYLVVANDNIIAAPPYFILNLQYWARPQPQAHQGLSVADLFNMKLVNAVQVSGRKIMGVYSK